MGANSRYADTEGRLALVAWRAERGIAVADLAELFGVAVTRIRQWLAGQCRPHDHERILVETLTGVPRDSWFLKRELEELAATGQRIKAVRAKQPKAVDFTDRIALRL